MPQASVAILVASRRLSRVELPDIGEVLRAAAERGSLQAVVAQLDERVQPVLDGLHGARRVPTDGRLFARPSRYNCI